MAKSLGFQEVVLSLYERERNVFVPHAQIGLDDRWTEMRGKEVAAEEITRHWTERNRVSKSFHVRDRSERDARLSGVSSRRVLTTGEEGWRPDELLWIPLTLGEGLEVESFVEITCQVPLPQPFSQRKGSAEICREVS